METGDKNRDDFHCMEMSLVMRMQFISVMTEMTHVSLALTEFSSNGGPLFSCNYARHAGTSPSRMRNYYSGEILRVCGFLRRYVSQNIVAITGNVRLNRFTLFYVFN